MFSVLSSKHQLLLLELWSCFNDGFFALTAELDGVFGDYHNVNKYNLFVSSLLKKEWVVCVKEGEKLLRIHLHAFEMQEVQEAMGLGEG